MTSLLLTLLTFLTLAALAHTTSAGVTRKYFIAAEEVTWDYYGGNKDLLKYIEKPRRERVETSDDRVGSRYTKAVYQQYTDATFTQVIQKPVSLGLVGPVIHGEVGDVIEVVFLNNASRQFSMHPHGLMYSKRNEGSIYVDGTSGHQKSDDIVAPGDSVTLTWHVTDAPGPNDPNCLPWVYHSHVSPPEDTSAGLIGVIVTCRPGTLDASNHRTDVDHEYPLLVKIWDENLSWYNEENAARCGQPQLCRSLAEDEDFVDSNYMAAINGYMYGTLPGITAQVNERVAFYVIGMGNEFDVHSLHFTGQNLHYRHQRGDTISVFSATFVAAEMTPREAGHWLVTDMVGDNKQNGMAAFFVVTDNDETLNATMTSPVREYFLSAELSQWDYGPSSVDGRTGRPLTDSRGDAFKFFEKNADRIGGIYTKARFVGYTNSTFSVKEPRSNDDLYLGTLGHVIRAEAGDTVKVTVRNNVKDKLSLQFHGMIYAYAVETSEGNDWVVGPGKVQTYTFKVPGDLFDDKNASCLVYMYTSAYNPLSDPNTGLVGPVHVCRRGYFLDTSTLHQHKFLLFQTVDENKSLYLDRNMPSKQTDTGDEGFVESNLMSSINGFSFGNLPEVTFCVGDDVTWHVMSLGNTEDVHTASFHGNGFSVEGRHRDTAPLVPGSTASLSMTLDNPGRWMVESHSNWARQHGMYGFYKVNRCGHVDEHQSTGKTREVFIAAEEVDWDYAPKERSIITGRDLNDPRDNLNIFFRDDDDFIGDVYKKAIYRGYTDASFTHRLTPDPADLHKGMLGPLVRAEVGDVIAVTFSNKASRPYSIHAHGVLASETDSGDSYHPHQAVAPGQMKRYTWRVPERAGPGSNDPQCVPWIYYSGVDPVKDLYAGLVGLLVICRPGTLNAAGRRRDVDREFAIMMSVINENDSWYLDDNVRDHAPNRRGTDFLSDGDFEESNIMHAINGHLSGNTEHLDMFVNDTVAWYFASVGAEVDLHSFHLHGHTVLRPSLGLRTDVINLFPGQAEAVEMLADVAGTWLLHCHQLDHIVAGMQAVYTVRDRDERVKEFGGAPPGSKNIGNQVTTKTGLLSPLHQLLSGRAAVPAAHHFPAGNTPLPVYISVSLLDLVGVRKFRQELDLLVTYTLQWAEPRLAWSPAHGDRRLVVPSSLLWTPDVVPLSLSQPLKPLFPADVVVSHTGGISWERSVRLTVLCDIDGSASCGIKFGSWNHDNKTMQLRPAGENVDLSGYFHASKFQVTNASLTSGEEIRQPGSKLFSYVKASFQFLAQKRK